jgi:hypothetical protein
VRRVHDATTARRYGPGGWPRVKVTSGSAGIRHTHHVCLLRSLSPSVGSWVRRLVCPIGRVGFSGGGGLTLFRPVDSVGLTGFCSVARRRPRITGVT